MTKKALIGALVIVLAAGVALAGSNKMGTAGAQELRIPVGSRGTAMAGAIVGDATGCEALFWNPAGAAKATGTEAFISYRGYIADTDLSYFSLVSPFSFGTIGVSAKILSLGDIMVTTETDWNGTGEVYSINIPVLGLTYASMLTDRVAFGATAMFVSEEVMQSRARGLAFDFGFQYVPGWRTGWGRSTCWVQDFASGPATCSPTRRSTSMGRRSDLGPISTLGESRHR
jgi:hypothetical protein